MVDISRLAQVVDALPRNLELSTNTVHVGSLKVGAADPRELTKNSMLLLSKGLTVETDIQTLQNSGVTGLAASFTLDSTVTGALVLGAYIALNGGWPAPGTISLGIYSDDSGSPGGEIAEAAITGTPTEGWALLTATLPSITLLKGANYWFVLTGDFTPGSYLLVKTFLASEQGVAGSSTDGFGWSPQLAAPLMQISLNDTLIKDVTNTGSRVVMTNQYGMIPAELIPAGSGGGGSGGSGGSATTGEIEGIAGEVLSAGDVVYIKPGNGRMWKASAADIATCRCIAGVVTTPSVLAGGSVSIAFMGKVITKVESGASPLVGWRAYLSATSPGTITGAPPETGVVILLGGIMSFSGPTAEVLVNTSLQYVVE